MNDPVPDQGVWFRVETNSAASAVRRTAERLAMQLRLSPERLSDLSIVAAEMASNLVKHADEGVLLVRPVRRDDQAAVELIAIDTGPGMGDLVRSARDGHSTAGTLGIGLGAITRKASWYDAYSALKHGTVIAVQVWPGAPPTPVWAAGIVRPLTGETVSGDGFATRVVDGRHQVLLCDGLGHGPLAAAATNAAGNAFRAAPGASPSGVVEHLHQALRHTRGAALAVAELSAAEATLRYAGLGNIAASVVTDSVTRRLVSLPGIAGHQRRVIREYDYPFSDEAVLVMHTDGVGDRWRFDDYPGLLARSPLLLAATVLRDAGVRRDDAGVLVARAPL